MKKTLLFLAGMIASLPPAIVAVALLADLPIWLTGLLGMAGIYMIFASSTGQGDGQVAKTAGAILSFATFGVGVLTLGTFPVTGTVLAILGGTFLATQLLIASLDLWSTTLDEIKRSDKPVKAALTTSGKILTAPFRELFSKAKTIKEQYSDLNEQEADALAGLEVTA